MPAYFTADSRVAVSTPKHARTAQLQFDTRAEGLLPDEDPSHLSPDVMWSEETS
jgi:hypothetical protein